MRILTVFVLLPLVACSSSGKAPVLPSSSNQTAYAIHYNDELTSATKAAGDAEARVQTLSSGFAATIDQLKKPDWQKVEAIIDDSDRAGKSADFADAEGDGAAVKSFWDAGKNDISGRMNGTASAKLRESGCGGDVGPTIAYALNEAITHQLQKNLRAGNEAFVVIERYRVPLGPQNVTALEKLADDISEASYDVHVLMVNQKNRLDRLGADKDDVKKTLDRFIQEETAYQAETGRTDAEKKASSDRVTAANKSKAEIDNSASQAESVAKNLEKQTDAATKEYEDGLKAAKAKVADKKKSGG